MALSEYSFKKPLINSCTHKNTPTSNQVPKDTKAFVIIVPLVIYQYTKPKGQTYGHIRNLIELNYKTKFFFFFFF